MAERGTDRGLWVITSVTMTMVEGSRNRKREKKQSGVWMARPHGSHHNIFIYSAQHIYIGRGNMVQESLAIVIHIHLHRNTFTRD